MSTRTFEINTPIWSTQSVGVAEDKICDENFIKILVTNKDGERLYPDTYKASRDELMRGEIMYTKKGNIKLRVVPIASLAVVEGENDER